MNRNSLAIATGLAMASLAGPAPAQVADRAGSGTLGIVTDAVGCTHTFGSGEFVWCLSSTGNLQRLTAPAGDVAAFIGFDVSSLGAGRRVAVKVAYQVQ